jgi:hypothetical protein
MSLLRFSQNTLNVNESIYKESPGRILDITDIPLVYTLAPGKKLILAVSSLGGATVVMAGIPVKRHRSCLGKGRRRCCGSPGIGSWPGLGQKWRVRAQPAEEGGGAARARALAKGIHDRGNKRCWRLRLKLLVVVEGSCEKTTLERGSPPWVATMQDSSELDLYAREETRGCLL